MIPGVIITILHKRFNSFVVSISIEHNSTRQVGSVVKYVTVNQKVHGLHFALVYSVVL